MFSECVVELFRDAIIVSIVDTETLLFLPHLWKNEESSGEETGILSCARIIWKSE